MSCTAIAPTNLALIKYWGKRDASLNLPINSSLSVTLDQRDLQTITTASFADDKDRLWVNGEEVEVESIPRTVTVLKEFRKLIPPSDPRHSRPIHLASKNSFPTAAGLASSAAGYSAMVTALAGLFELDFEGRKEEFSRIARQGSGSACRSLMGGFVAWNMGNAADGSDSQAEQICAASHWPTLEAVICVASDKKKSVSSTSGMQTSVKTSQLLGHRAEAIVPTRFEQIKRAIKDLNTECVWELTMKESNQFHACCLDTCPPIFYLTDTSRRIIHVVNELNQQGVKYAYTFDAGPNAVIFTESQNVHPLLQRLVQMFPPCRNDLRVDADYEFVRGRTRLTRAQILDDLPKKQEQAEDLSGDLLYLFHTGVGQGARILTGAEEDKYRNELFSQKN